MVMERNMVNIHLVVVTRVIEWMDTPKGKRS